MGTSAFDEGVVVTPRQQRRSRLEEQFKLLVGGVLIALLGYLGAFTITPSPAPSIFTPAGWLAAHRHYSFGGAHRVDRDAWAATLDRCKALRTPAGPPPGFASRTKSDRASPSTKPVLIRNATLWTGRKLSADRTDPGETLLNVDVLLEDGLIRSVASSGSLSANLLQETAERDRLDIDAQGRWVTPGIVDVHIHAGNFHLPRLDSVQDTNSGASPTTPSLRSIDGSNSHDLSFVRIAAGGVTSGLILPGSGNNVGGQAFPVKLGRQTEEDAKRGTWRRIIDPPASLALPGDGGASRSYPPETGMQRPDGSSSWRYMKNACGENARRVYDITRMDEARGFRGMFDNARKLKERQDNFCASALSLAAKGVRPLAGEESSFPDDLELEAVVDILRGKVKVNTHCYTTTDLEAYVRHTNEFKFPLAAFHHAHETYLVPDLLKQVYGGPPAVALFSLNAGYKFEALFGSPYAGAVLARSNLTVLFKSDHPVTDSRRVVSQAAQAHHFGLPLGEALRSVTTHAAEALGLSHRIGYAQEGYDADLVLWDQHPLSLGAQPLQVFVDGQPQLDLELAETVAHAPRAEPVRAEVQQMPRGGNYSDEVQRVERSSSEIISWRSKGFTTPLRTVKQVVFRNVGKVYRRRLVGSGVEEVDVKSRNSSAGGNATGTTVVVVDGEVVCTGPCAEAARSLVGAETIDLRGGTILPGLTSYGPDLGQTDIVSEPQTLNGFASLRSTYASLLPQGSSGPAAEPYARAVDGLQWGSNDARIAHWLGVRTGVVAPRQRGFLAGVSAHFDLGADHALQRGAVRKRDVAMHVRVDHWQDGEQDRATLAEGEQIAALRALLDVGRRAAEAEDARGGERQGGDAVSKGGRDDVLGDTDASSADPAKVWARVVRGELPLVVSTTRAERIASLVELKRAHRRLRLVVADAAEASLFGLPLELSRADVSVLLRPQVWARFWDERRAPAGPPLTRRTVLGELLDAGVRVGMLLDESWQAATLLWDTVQAAKEAGGLSEEQTLALVTTNMDDIFGLEVSQRSDFVAYDGNPFEYGARVVAVGTPRGVDIFAE